MGRLQNSGNYSKKKFQSDSNALKTRHRSADTKYRSNIQYLYSKLKEMSKNKAAKDCLLGDSLWYIQCLENEIIEKVGHDELENYRKKFSNFLLYEETLWKIKDADRWWRKVEEAVISDDSFKKSLDYDEEMAISLNLAEKTTDVEYLPPT